MASSIEVVPIVASAVASDVPSEILPLKRVRKAILKPKSPSKMPKIQQKSEETSETIPETVATIPKTVRARAKKTIPEAIVGETNPTNDAKGNNSARNVVKKGLEATIVSKNSDNLSVETIVDEEMPHAADFSETNGNSSGENSSGSEERGDSSEILPQKRGRGRPQGSKDTKKRAPRGSLNKPPVQHGKLGRPPGSKNKATIALETANMEIEPQPVPKAAAVSSASAAARDVIASTYVPQPKVSRPATCRESIKRIEANHLGSLVTRMFHA